MPLFVNATGVTVLSLLIDALHTLYLGLVAEFCSQAIWELILSNAWALPGDPTQPEMLEPSCNVIAGELPTFYASLDRGIVSTPIQDSSSSMIGTKLDRSLALTG